MIMIGSQKFRVLIEEDVSIVHTHHEEPERGYDHILQKQKMIESDGMSHSSYCEERTQDISENGVQREKE